VREVLAANAQLLVLARQQRKKKGPSGYLVGDGARSRPPQ